jgi:hypothetical protein
MPRSEKSYLDSPSGLDSPLPVTAALHRERLEAMQRASTTSEALGAMCALGVTEADLAEGLGIPRREARRLLHGAGAEGETAQAVERLRAALTHALQRGGVETRLMVPWMRLPDPSLGFLTPLRALAQGRFRVVIDAFDEYVCPRHFTAVG